MTTSGGVGIELAPEVAGDPRLAARLDDPDAKYNHERHELASEAAPTGGQRA